MGCGCVSQHQIGLPGSIPRKFLDGETEKDFVKRLEKHELQDKKLLLVYFSLEYEGQFQVTEELRDLVRRRGVPQRFRWRVWKALTGWSALYRPGEYERILQKYPDAKTIDAIDKDLDRTFPGIEDFGDEKKLELASLLRAHASLFPEVGYCQGMNFVGGFLLLAAGNAADGPKDAFFLLVQLMVKYRANLLFCDGLPLLKLHTFQFRVLLERFFPDVHKHFVDKQITPELYLTKWILTMFTQPLPFHSAARVWDLIVCDGLQALVSIALASVKLLRARLLREDTEGLMELLSLRRGDGGKPPVDGGDIVKAALALQTQMPPGCRTNVTFRHNKLFAEWEKEFPAEAAYFQRAEEQICRAREESPLEQPVVTIPLAPPEVGIAQESFTKQDGSCDGAAVSAGVELSVLMPPTNAASALPSRLSEDDVVAGERRPGTDKATLTGESSGQIAEQVSEKGFSGEVPNERSVCASPRVVAAEAKVAVNPSMQARPTALRVSATRSRSSQGAGWQGPSPTNSSAGQGLCIELQSGGPLLSADDAIWAYGPNASTEGMLRRDIGRDPGSSRSGLKVSGSPPAPAPDVRRGAAASRGSPVRSLSGGAEEFILPDGGEDSKPFDLGERSHYQQANHEASSHSPEEQRFGHTWPMEGTPSAQQACTVGQRHTTPTLGRLVSIRARSRDDGSDEGRGTGRTTPRNEEGRRVRSLSPNVGDRSASPHMLTGSNRGRLLDAGGSAVGRGRGGDQAVEGNPQGDTASAVSTYRRFGGLGIFSPSRLRQAWEPPHNAWISPSSSSADPRPHTAPADMQGADNNDNEVWIEEASCSAPATSRQSNSRPCNDIDDQDDWVPVPLSE